MTLPTDQPPTATTNVQPIPPRYWWLKRILILASVVAMALICLRVWWGHVAHTRLQAEIDRIRAAGEPIYPEDFDPEPVPDKDNAAIFLQKAQDAITSPDDVELTIDDIYDDPQLLVTHTDQVARIIEANEKVLRLLRKARSASGVDWGMRPRSPMINFLLPNLSGQRQLVRFACLAARYQHQMGDDAAAVETLRDVFGAGRCLEESNTSLIGHLVAIAISSIGANVVEEITPSVLIATGRDSKAEFAGPARPQQIVALIADLLDEAAHDRGMQWALYSERAFLLDAAQLAGRGQANLVTMSTTPSQPAPFEVVLAFPIKPMIELDAWYMMEHMSAIINAMQEPTWPAASKRVPTVAPPRQGIDTLRRILSNSMMPSFTRVWQKHYRALGMRRMAAVALAIRLFEIDHKRRPETLNELVPHYLPAIPSDPFAADGRPIGYVPDAPRPILYSVNLDGIDEQGAFQLTQCGSVDWEASDMPFFLDGDRPRCPSNVAVASVQTDEEQGDVEKDQRDAGQDQTTHENPKNRD